MTREEQMKADIQAYDAARLIKVWPIDPPNFTTGDVEYLLDKIEGLRLELRRYNKA